MIGLALKSKANTRTEFKKYYRRAKRKTADSLIGAAALIRTTARRSIRKSKKSNPAKPGKPPRTRFGLLRRSILFNVDKARQVAVIGPSFEKIKRAGAAHEHGGKFRKRKYPARPYMGPALEKSRDKIPAAFRGKIT